MADNIITAVFGATRETKVRPRYRYDQGQVLIVRGVKNLPDFYEVHFANEGSTADATPLIGTSDGVTIPDSYFQSGATIYAYIYVHDEATDGTTVYKVTIPIINRARPANVEPTPEQEDIIAQAIVALNENVGKAEDAAEQAEASAVRAETAADGVEALTARAEAAAQAAEASETNASSSATTAQTAAQSSASSANTAATARNAAQSARNAAQSARDDAQSASETSIQAANAAITARNSALTYANNAQTAANTANSARSGAEAARSAAVSAKTTAESAATRAETAAGQITGMTADAETLTPDSPATASFLDGVLSLGIPAGATGATGADGNGIVSITKTGTQGTVDTYTITYTNGTTSTFTVRNGVDGAVTSVAGKTGAVTLDAGDVEYDDTDTYAAGSVGAGLADLKSQTSYAENELLSINGQYSTALSYFEFGNVNIRDGALVYVDSNTRVRTREGFLYHLSAGVQVSLTSYNDYVFYIGTTAGGTWVIRDVYTVPTDGDYFIIIRKATESVITDISLPVSFLRIYSDSNELTEVRVNANRALSDVQLMGKSFVDYAGNYIINPDDFDIGNIAMTAGSDPVYAARDSRVRTKPGVSIHLPAGVLVGLRDYHDARFYIGWYYNDYFNCQGWVTSDTFTTPVEADYIILLCNKTEVKVTDKNVLLDLLYIKNPYAEMYPVPIKTMHGFINSINHKGYNVIAPENTLSAFKMSAQMGFPYIECDVQFTSDDVPVILHDTTINRTARNADGTTISTTINISSITYAQALDYDFGIYKGTEYAGTPIPTLLQTVMLCKALGLHMYVEIKGDTATQSKVESCVDIVKSCGMADNVTWISFSPTVLGYIKAVNPRARLGLLAYNVTATIITNAESLKTDDNIVFVDSQTYTSSEIDLCKAANIPLEVWTIDVESTILSLDPYITGVTSNNINAERALYLDNIK